MEQAQLGLQDVDIKADLAKRPFRAPNYEAENHALTALVQTLANAPETILQKLAETALQLCSADTAGISLLEQKDGAEVFRWEALAGVFSDRRNATMPRNASPCGTTIDRNATQLMYRAARVFPALTSVPPVVEALLIPFHVAQVPIGTVWVVAHDERRKFDQEDERIIKTLAQFASACWQLWRAHAVALSAVKQERQRAKDLVAANVTLQAHLANKTRVEEELQQLNSELQVRIRESAGTMTTGQADGGKNAGIVHELNNILNVIQAYAELIMSHPAEPNQVVEDAEVITATIRKGVVLARQLLEAERELEPKLELADVNDLLQRMNKLLIPMFPATTVIVADLDPSVPMIMVNAGLINQAILNLCLNARDAMPAGGKLLLQTRLISGAAVRERFPEASAEPYAAISVADTGVGMAQEAKQRAFELYFTTKKHGQGSGLGLSIVHDIVTQHTGFVEVTSEPGYGSTFHIYLPIRGGEAAADTTPLSEQTSVEDRRPQTVLYAEDESSLALLMRRLLEREGFKVLTAQDGAEAVEVYDRHKDEIAVVILDSGLAKLNGWDALQEMRKFNPKLKGILASGYVSAEAESRVANGELCGALQKPYVGAEVLALVKQAICSQ
jgi:signal transduction histidine kinase/ActR/RegA family two-component response regulator